MQYQLINLPVEVDLLAVVSLPSDGGPELVGLAPLRYLLGGSVWRHHCGHPNRQLLLGLIGALKKVFCHEFQCHHMLLVSFILTM